MAGQLIGLHYRHQLPAWSSSTVFYLIHGFALKALNGLDLLNSSSLFHRSAYIYGKLYAMGKQGVKSVECTLACR